MNIVFIVLLILFLFIIVMEVLTDSCKLCGFRFWSWEKDTVFRKHLLKEHRGFLEKEYQKYLRRHCRNEEEYQKYLKTQGRP